jgi:hypothetical protein
MVIYAAGAGQKALDRLGASGSSPNGVFTRVLVREIERGGLPVHEVVRSVRQAEARLAECVGHEQVPALYDQAIGDFFFRRGARTPPDGGGRSTGDGAADQDLWQDARRLDTVEAYDAYLDAHPSGRYAPMARAARKKRQTAGTRASSHNAERIVPWSR